MRKLTVLLFFLIFSVAAHAQQHTLLKILNGELRKEVKNQLKSPQFSGDTIRIVRPFEISKDNILSLEIEKRSPYLEGV